MLMFEIYFRDWLDKMSHKLGQSLGGMGKRNKRQESESELTAVPWLEPLGHWLCHFCDEED